MAEKKKWIGKATENAHGQFKRKAERAGKSTLAYARDHDEGGSKTAKQARLAEALISASHHAHKQTASHKAIRKGMYGKE